MTARRQEVNRTAALADLRRYYPPAATEAGWLRQVQDLASILGWRTYHPYLSIRSTRGWPDLALVRPPRYILAELKRDGGKLTRAQVEWIELLRQCPGIEVYVWFPRDLAAIAVVLR